MEGYQEDLAYIHDVGFTGFARGAVPGLLTLLKQNGVAGGLVVDLGCGSGVWARELVQSGYDVLGIDQSSAMLDIARPRVPTARFVKGSFLDAELPPCQAVTAISECFNYLFDEANTTDALVDCFRQIHDALVPGGLLIFDVAGPGRGGGPGRHAKNCFGDDWAILLETEEDPVNLTLTRYITSFRKVGELYRRSYEEHHVRLMRAQEIRPRLAEVGFASQLLSSYGPMEFPPGLWGVVACRGK